MIEHVTKRDGSKEKFDPEKMIKWAEWSSVVGVDWFDIVGSSTIFFISNIMRIITSIPHFIKQFIKW